MIGSVFVKNILCKFKSRKGTSLILFAIALSSLMGFCALVVDIGNVSVEKQKFQNAVDSATVAAAQELPDTAKATTTANHYIQLNGYTSSDVSISFEDSNKTINITGTKTINYLFAKVIGYNNTTIHPAASATVGSMGEAFDYALFSGSTTRNLTINGSSQYIDGDVHTNLSFIANGSRLTITGTLEAVSMITTNGSQINIGARDPDADVIPMPDFSDTIKLQAEQAGQSYNGDRTFNSSNINLDSPIYVNGNVTVNGSHFTGKGCILATGTITFNGSNLNSTTDDAVCFYSKSGNITINGSNAVFDGILYAPKGSITMNGSNQTVNGRVIANTVTFNGSNLNIIGGTNELSSLPSNGVALIR
jgi:Flp pilus assembly protein TadG